MLAKNHLIIDDIDEILVTSIKERSDRLLIYFGWATASSMVSMSGIAPMLNLNTSSIVIRDPTRNWYNLPIEGLSRDADDLAAQIERRIGSFPRDKITACGSSMGGYAAILFGLKLGVGRIVACAPQLMLHPNLPHSPKVPVTYTDLTPMIVRASKETKIDIWYGAESFMDLYNLLRLRPRPNVSLNAIPGSMHNVMSAFKRRGEIDAFFRYMALGEPFTTKTVTIPREARGPVTKAGRMFYVNQDYKAVIRTLKQIADDVDLSPVYCVIADCFYRLSEFEKARIWYERAAAASHQNYDAHYGLGLTLEKLGKDRPAERAFKTSQDYFPSKDSERFARLASVQFRLGKMKEAHKNYKIALDSGACPPKVHFEVAQILLEKGSLRKALEHFEVHAAANPHYKPTLAHIASLKERIALMDAEVQEGMAPSD